jgi:hypothetical protein
MEEGGANKKRIIIDLTGDTEEDEVEERSRKKKKPAEKIPFVTPDPKRYKYKRGFDISSDCDNDSDVMPEETDVMREANLQRMKELYREMRSFSSLGAYLMGKEFK